MIVIVMALHPVLYSFRRCPYAMRARMALAVSGVCYEHREILLRNKPPAMLALSPKGTVPVIMLPNNRAIDESLEIMRWALAQNDPDSWLDRVDDNAIAANDGPFKHALDRYKYPYRFGLEDGIGHRDAGLQWLKILDKRLTSQIFLSGNHICLTDIAIFPFVRQFAETDRAWFDGQPIAALQQWLSGLVCSPLFEKIMVKHLLWSEEQEA